MKNIAANTIKYAEYGLACSVIFYWYYSGTQLNFLAIGLLLLLMFQFVFKKTISGIVIPVVFILLSLVMMVALQSELSDFKVFDKEAQTMLIVGGGYLTGSLLTATAMFFNYFKRLQI